MILPSSWKITPETVSLFVFLSIKKTNSLCIIASYLINLSQAVGRLILTGRDLTRFAGYTVSFVFVFCGSMCI